MRIPLSRRDAAISSHASEESRPIAEGSLQAGPTDSTMQLTMGQSNYSIRALIRHVGLVAAFLVAIATPAIYWVVVTHHQEKAIDFKIQQSAERSARYIASNDKLWMDQPMRLGEIIDYGEAVSAELSQRVITVDGVTVVEIGARLAEPLLKVSKPMNMPRHPAR